MSQDMTRGNPARLILLFALPLFVGNLFQQLYNMADTLIVGRALGAQASAEGDTLTIRGIGSRRTSCGACIFILPPKENTHP